MVVAAVEIRVSNQRKSLLLMILAIKVYRPKLKTVRIIPTIVYLLARIAVEGEVFLVESMVFIISYRQKR